MADIKINEVPLTTSAQHVLVTQGNGDLNRMDISKFLTQPSEDNLAYGVEWDESVTTMPCTRVGNLALHRTLPVHNRMRGCLFADNGTVNAYLPGSDWTGVDRSGASGQVMVELPKDCYWRFTSIGTKMRAMVSEYPLPGYEPMPNLYAGAYQASLQRSTGKLSSVANTSTDYRGGDNNASYDDTYRTRIGIPVVNMSRTQFRTAARKRGAYGMNNCGWNQYLYDVQCVLAWLFVIEYATFDAQAAYNPSLDANGFHQGGLGTGISDFNNVTTWSGNIYGTVPCGHTDSLGNRSGAVKYEAKNADNTIAYTGYAPRYRGIEHPFGHIWMHTDGINIEANPDTSAGGSGLSRIMYTADPSKFSDSSYAGYTHIGNFVRGASSNYIKSIIGGRHILPKAIGGSASTYYRDGCWESHGASSAEMRCVHFGGRSAIGAICGLFAAHAFSAPSYSYASIGSRLCFIP